MTMGMTNDECLLSNEGMLSLYFLLLVFAFRIELPTYCDQQPHINPNITKILSHRVGIAHPTSVMLDSTDSEL